MTHMKYMTCVKYMNRSKYMAHVKCAINVKFMTHEKTHEMRDIYRQREICDPHEWWDLGKILELREMCDLYTSTESTPRLIQSISWYVFCCVCVFLPSAGTRIKNVNVNMKCVTCIFLLNKCVKYETHINYVTMVKYLNCLKCKICIFPLNQPLGWFSL